MFFQYVVVETLHHSLVLSPSPQSWNSFNMSD
jgi:hypothetical protein